MDFLYLRNQPAGHFGSQELEVMHPLTSFSLQSLILHISFEEPSGRGLLIVSGKHGQLAAKKLLDTFER